MSGAGQVIDASAQLRALVVLLAAQAAPMQQQTGQAAGSKSTCTVGGQLHMVMEGTGSSTNLPAVECLV